MKLSPRHPALRVRLPLSLSLRGHLASRDRHVHEKLIAEHQRRGGAVPQGAGAGGAADDVAADERARELGAGGPLMHSPAVVMKRAPTGSTAVHPTRSAECTFAPRTKGVAPGMAAAAHYTSTNVFDRLTREVRSRRPPRPARPPFLPPPVSLSLSPLSISLASLSLSPRSLSRLSLYRLSLSPRDDKSGV